MNPDYRKPAWNRNPHPKLCHARIGDKVQLLTVRGVPLGPIYTLIVFDNGQPAGRPGMTQGLYDEKRMLRLFEPLTATYRPLPSLSSRVKIFPQDRSAEKMARHAKNYGKGADAFLRPFVARLQSILERNTMLKNIESAHFTDGGTGVTNFGTASDAERDRLLPIYLEAIKRFGDDNIVVSGHLMRNSAAPGGYSLHYIGLPMASNLSDFWKVFEAVERERTTETKSLEVGGKKFVVTRTGDMFLLDCDVDCRHLMIARHRAGGR